MKAQVQQWYWLRWTDGGGLPSQWYVFRTAESGRDGFKHTELIAKARRWNAAPDVRVSADGIPGHVRIQASRVIFDTNEPDLLIFSNDNSLPVYVPERRAA